MLDDQLPPPHLAPPNKRTTYVLNLWTRTDLCLPPLLAPHEAELSRVDAVLDVDFIASCDTGSSNVNCCVQIDDFRLTVCAPLVGLLTPPPREPPLRRPHR